MRYQGKVRSCDTRKRGLAVPEKKRGLVLRYQREARSCGTRERLGLVVQRLGLAVPGRG